MKKREKIFAAVLLLYLIGGCLAAQETKQGYKGIWINEADKLRLHLFVNRFAVFSTEYDFEAMGFLAVSGNRLVFDTREYTFPNTPTTADKRERLQKLVLFIAAGEVPGLLAASSGEVPLFSAAYYKRMDNQLIIRVVDENSETTLGYSFVRHDFVRIK
jgi:hypothetical protein